MPKSEYRLLSPAHFVLEQMRKITNKPDAVFVSLPLSQLEKSINHITSQGSEFNSDDDSTIPNHSNVESRHTDDETNHSNVESRHTDDEANPICKCNCS